MNLRSFAISFALIFGSIGTPSSFARRPGKVKEGQMKGGTREAGSRETIQSLETGTAEQLSHRPFENRAARVVTFWSQIAAKHAWRGRCRVLIPRPLRKSRDLCTNPHLRTVRDRTSAIRTTASSVLITTDWDAEPRRHSMRGSQAAHICCLVTPKSECNSSSRTCRYPLFQFPECVAVSPTRSGRLLGTFNDRLGDRATAWPDPDAVASTPVAGNPRAQTA